MENTVRIAGEQGVAVPGGIDEARFLLGHQQHGGIGCQSVIGQLRYRQIGFKGVIGNIQVDRDVRKAFVDEVEKYSIIVLREEDAVRVDLKVGTAVLGEEDGFVRCIQ